nr:hypothetical protein [Actinomycetota bacterium]
MHKRDDATLSSEGPAGATAIARGGRLMGPGATVANDLFASGVSPLELAEARALLAMVGLALLPQSWRRRRAPLLISLMGAVPGVILVPGLLAGDVGVADGLGIAMGLAAAVFFSIYTVLSEDAGAAFGSIGAMFRGFVIGSAFWVLFQIPRGWPLQSRARAARRSPIKGANLKPWPLHGDPTTI